MSAGEFAQFEIKVSNQEHQVTGKIHYPPSLLTDRGNARWDDYTGRKVKHSEPTQLLTEKWCLIYSEQDYDQANICFEMMQDASATFGVKVQEPFWVEVKDSKGSVRDGLGYIEHLQGFPFKQYRIAIVIIHDPKHKKAIKSHLDKQGIPS